MKRSHVDELQTALFLTQLSGPQSIECLGWRNDGAVWRKQLGDMTYEILAHPNHKPEVSRRNYSRWEQTLEDFMRHSGEELEDD